MEQVLSALWSYVPSHCLQVATEIGLFDALNRPNGPRETKSLAQELSVSEEGLMRLLAVLASMRLLDGDNEAWALSPISRKYLVGDSKNTLVDFVPRAAVLRQAYERLRYVVATGTSDKQMSQLTDAAFGADPIATERFARVMEAMSAVLAAGLVESIDLSQCKSCLDIGSGWGVFGRVISRYWPYIEMTMLDRPGVIDGAINAWKSEFPAASATFISGDWHKDLPENQFDLVLLSQVLHEEPPVRALKLLDNACRRVSDDGRLVIVQFELADDLCGPELTAIFNMNMFIETGGRSFSLKELRSTFSLHSMILTGHIPLGGGRTAIVAKRE